MNKQQIKGRVKAVKGRVKEATGKLVGDKAMDKKGKAEKIAGKHQAARADLKDDIKKLAEA